MATVAEQLRTARESQQLTIQQIAEITNVRADHIRAIEQGNYDVFSAPIYIRGFVRSYCKILKLDSGPVITQLNAELDRTDKFSEPPPLTDEPRTVVDFLTLQLSKINWRKALIGVLILIVVVMIYGFVQSWRSDKNKDHLKGLRPGVYQSGTNQPINRAPLPVSPR
jgi:cytoskeletal protein RodZ